MTVKQSATLWREREWVEEDWGNQASLTVSEPSDTLVMLSWLWVPLNVHIIPRSWPITFSTEIIAAKRFSSQGSWHYIRNLIYLTYLSFMPLCCIWRYSVNERIESSVMKTLCHKKPVLTFMRVNILKCILTKRVHNYIWNVWQEVFHLENRSRTKNYLL